MSGPRERKIVHILLIPMRLGLTLEDEQGCRPLRAREKNGTWVIDPEGGALVLAWEGKVVPPSLDWLYRYLWQSYIVDTCDEDLEDIERLVNSDEVSSLGYTFILRE